jgi:uncharacterized membrane protein
MEELAQCQCATGFGQDSAKRRSGVTTVRETLLTIHLLSVVVWLGAGLYDFFLTREIVSAAGQPAELPLIRIHLRYGPVVAVAMMLVFTSGILMSALLGWGFFTSTWLEMKQLLMPAIIVMLIGFVPLIVKLTEAVKAVGNNAVSATDEIRALIYRSERYEVAMRLAALIALVLAV